MSSVFNSTESQPGLIWTAVIANKILEAVATGLPVVTMPTAALAFPERPMGMLVGEGAWGLTRAIDRLAQDETLRHQTGDAATSFIHSAAWSWRNRTDRLIDLMRRLVETCTRKGMNTNPPTRRSTPALSLASHFS